MHTLNFASGSHITKSASIPSLSCPLTCCSPQSLEGLWLKKRDTSAIEKLRFLASVQKSDSPGHNMDMYESKKEIFLNIDICQS
jgi:hypothetical protein